MYRLEILIARVRVGFFVLVCCLLVGLEQISRHLGLVAFYDVIILGVVLFEYDTHFDDGDAVLQFLNHLRSHFVQRL